MVTCLLREIEPNVPTVQWGSESLNCVLGLIISGLIAASATQQTPPIFQPGAPGAAPRVITAAQALELSRTGFTEGDVRFMQHMIVHHAQAVEMVDLLKVKGSDPMVRRLGERIALGQEAEMVIMEAWLASREQPTAMSGMDHAEHGGMDHAGHQGHGDMPAPSPSETPLMPGMLSPAQMARLAAASGAAFDRLFLEGMIQHHIGALDMVDALQAEPDAAEDPILSDFLSSVVADQNSEILRMQSLLSDILPPEPQTSSTSPAS